LTLSDDISAVLRDPGGGETAVPFTPLRIWDAQTGKETLALSGYDDEIASADFSPDGKRVLACPRDRLSRYKFDSASGMVLEQRSGANHPQKPACLWDLETGRPIPVLPWGNRVETLYAVYSPDGKRVLTHDGYGRISDASTGRELVRLEGDGSGTGPLFSPDGRQVLVSRFVTTQIWDADSGKKVATLSGHGAAITATAFSPDGRKVATGCRDGTLRIWEAATGVRLSLLRGHWRAVTSVAFSPDGHWVVTSSEDRTARIWEAEGGQEFLTLSGHTDAVRTAVFSADGQRVLTSSADGTVRIWPVDPLPLALRRTPRELTAEEREQSIIGTIGQR
jgi:WD40 repeat protein